MVKYYSPTLEKYGYYLELPAGKREKAEEVLTAFSELIDEVYNVQPKAMWAVLNFLLRKHIPTVEIHKRRCKNGVKTAN